MRVPVCPLSCSFKSTGTLIFVFAITGTGALATAFYFHLLFPSLFTTKHIVQFTMFDSISLQPARNITEIRNIS